MPDPWSAQMEALGAFIRRQRQLAQLSLRQMAELTSLSNPYLSQVERGLHQPSVRVLKAIAEALNISAETLLTQAGLLDGQDAAPADQATEQVIAAIRADRRLSGQQQAALIGVYDSMLAAADGGLQPAAAIRADQRLTSEQQAALIAVYDSMLAAAQGGQQTQP